ncbi:hypothetical protein GCM10008019_16650 [Deinococcus soli (ex Cha et al. 2016)]|nr:hypothetical protein GCM10008019_16650 [Deinococcus soli (ex Cha et al. 2016)]
MGRFAIPVAGHEGDDGGRWITQVGEDVWTVWHGYGILSAGGTGICDQICLDMEPLNLSKSD